MGQFIMETDGPSSLLERREYKKATIGDVGSLRLAAGTSS
jgi:hypothetical protein